MTPLGPGDRPRWTPGRKASPVYVDVCRVCGERRCHHYAGKTTVER